MTENQSKQDIKDDANVEKYIKLVYYIGKQYGIKYRWLYDDLISEAILSFMRLINSDFAVGKDDAHIKNYIGLTVSRDIRRYISSEMRARTATIEGIDIPVPLVSTTTLPPLLEMKSQGYSNRQIATILGVSHTTINKEIKKERALCDR